MNLQIIKSVEGKAEYVLLPMSAYKTLKNAIDKVLNEDYEPFNLDDYVDNPVAHARICSNLTQEALALKMDVSQAYISKLESQASVSEKVLAKVQAAILAIQKCR